MLNEERGEEATRMLRRSLHYCSVDWLGTGARRAGFTEVKGTWGEWDFGARESSDFRGWFGGRSPARYRVQSTEYGGVSHLS